MILHFVNSEKGPRAEASAEDLETIKNYLAFSKYMANRGCRLGCAAVRPQQQGIFQ